MKINPTAGHKQVHNKEEKISKTAFQTLYSSFECRVLNFSMPYAPSIFVTIINEAFKSLFGRCVVAYLDYTIVYSKIKQDNWRKLKSLMTITKQEKPITKPNKCQFVMQEFVILDHVASKDGIESDPTRSRLCWRCPHRRIKQKPVLFWE